MPKANEIFEYLNKLAPLNLQMDFDNSGFLVGDKNSEVKRCIVALDVTDSVIDEAIEQNAELIISHHPIIFNPQKSVSADELVGRKLIKLIKNDISVISMHTNLDIADGGVNDALMQVLACPVSGGLEPVGEGFCGRIGEYEEAIDFFEFLGICKKALNSNGLRYHYAGKPVKKLAVMGGSGGDCITLADELGCDTYVTADIKYGGFLDAKALGINVIDADHFCTENVIIPVISEKLGKMFPGLCVSVSETHSQTAKFY